VDVPSWAPGALDLRPQARDQAVEALHEDKGLARRAHVEAVLAHSAKVFLPRGDQPPSQADDAWLHPFLTL
jgi:hypothetical protein